MAAKRSKKASKKTARKAAPSRKPARASKASRRPAPKSKASSRPSKRPTARALGGPDTRIRCSATDPFGGPCQNTPRLGSKYCGVHSHLEAMA